VLLIAQGGGRKKTTGKQRSQAKCEVPTDQAKKEAMRQKRRVKWHEI